MANLLSKVELDKKLDKLDNQKLLLIIFACLVLLALDYNFIISRQSKGASQIQQKIARFKKDMDSLDTDLAMMQKTQAKLKDAVATKVQKIISENELPSLLQQISDIANKKNIKIMQIKPVKELKTKETKPAKSQTDEKSVALLITLDLVSGYHNLGGFINELENGSVYMAVEGLRIQSNPDNYFQQQISLALKTYVKD